MLEIFRKFVLSSFIELVLRTAQMFLYICSLKCNTKCLFMAVFMVLLWARRVTYTLYPLLRHQIATKSVLLYWRHSCTVQFNYSTFF